MDIARTGDSLAASFQDVADGVVGFLPELVIALVIFVVGWIVAALIGRVVDQVVQAIKLDKALSSAGLDTVLDRAGFSLNSGRFIGGLVKWFFIVVFLVAALDVLGLSQVNLFLQDVVLDYLPRVIVAVLMMLVAVVIADVMQKLVVGSARAAEMKSAAFLGTLTKWAIWVFAFIVVLAQLGIAEQFLLTLFTGVVVALSLAFGLSFGLGGQQAAGEMIGKIRKEISDHTHRD